MQCCPRDRASLVAQKVRGFSVSHCTTCAGLWLSPALVATAVGHLPHVSSKGKSASGKRCLCPADGSVLVAVHHRGVEIDVCTACGGVWLDHGELDLILRCKRSDYKSWNTVTSDSIAQIALEAGGQIVTDPDLLSAVGDFAGDAIGTILSFIAEALSGL
ncbi:MAG: zf-TFIIB domain-containing protein [Verrucomicrobia bacterium]|nr:zf-TFIIB domain-containing protein [Verrucomicrobiota bacterium]